MLPARSPQAAMVRSPPWTSSTVTTALVQRPGHRTGDRGPRPAEEEQILAAEHADRDDGEAEGGHLQHGEPTRCPDRGGEARREQAPRGCSGAATATTPDTTVSTVTAVSHSRRSAVRACRQQSRVWFSSNGRRRRPNRSIRGVDQAETDHQLQQGQVHRPFERRRVDVLVDPEAVAVGEADDHRADQDHDEVGHAVDGVGRGVPEDDPELRRFDDGDGVTASPGRVSDRMVR